MMKKRLILYLIFVSFFILTNMIGCSNNTIVYKKEFSEDRELLFQEIGKIKIELVEIKELPEGTNYTIKLKNGSPYLIKHNILYVSLPIKTQNGYKQNRFKIEATHNKLDIYPNQEIVLSAFAPIEMYRDNKFLDNMEPDYNFFMFLNEVKEENRFSMGGSLR